MPLRIAVAPNDCHNGGAEGTQAQWQMNWMVPSIGPDTKVGHAARYVCDLKKDNCNMTNIRRQTANDVTSHEDEGLK